MRIITGSARGTKLKAPRGLDTRPTTDRVKESIFNILGGEVVGVQVLDLFSGTGNLALEALSRGAAHAVAVDMSTVCGQIIQENAVHAKLQDRLELCRQDVFRVLERLAQTGRAFDLIFCDPPYNRGLVERVIERIEALGVLRDTGIIVIEHSRHEPVDVCCQRLRVVRSEAYGETIVSFLLYKTETAATGSA